MIINFSNQANFQVRTHSVSVEVPRYFDTTTTTALLLPLAPLFQQIFVIYSHFSFDSRAGSTQCPRFLMTSSSEQSSSAMVIVPHSYIIA